MLKRKTFFFFFPLFFILISFSLTGCSNGPISNEHLETISVSKEESVSETTFPEMITEETVISETTTEEAAISETTTEEAAISETTTEDSLSIFLSSAVPFEKEMQTSVNSNIRLLPSKDGAVEIVLPAGTCVTCIQKTDDWTAILYNEKTCYISTPLLEEVSVKPAVPTPVQTENGIYYSGTGPLIVIDPGHQAHGNSEKEPNAPGSDVLKAKVSTGTTGHFSGITEAELNLTVSLKLRDALIAKGYQVLMIRETADVDISNAERAVRANNAHADAFLRIHANGSDNSEVHGILTMAPSAANPYTNAAGVTEASNRLSQLIVDAMCTSTGANNQGVYQTDTMTGINWCTVPVSIIEMGYMTNQNEDLSMASDSYQNLLVTGMVNGVDAYFSR